MESERHLLEMLGCCDIIGSVVRGPRRAIWGASTVDDRLRQPPPDHGLPGSCNCAVVMRPACAAVESGESVLEMCGFADRIPSSVQVPRRALHLTSTDSGESEEAAALAADLNEALRRADRQGDKRK